MAPIWKVVKCTKCIKRPPGKIVAKYDGCDVYDCEMFKISFIFQDNFYRTFVLAIEAAFRLVIAARNQIKRIFCDSSMNA